MCPPDYYGIEYEINPWMNTERQADHGRAVEQWNGLRGKLEHAGARIAVVPPVAGLPDQVFTANAALIWKQQAVLSRFKHPQRQGEERHFRAWLESAGFEVVTAPAGTFFEGAGDALFCGETLYAGYRMRSDVGGHQEIGRRLGVPVIPVELVDARYYHLDTCFCPLKSDTAIYFPEAFDRYGRQTIEAHIPHLISLDAEEAGHFAANAVVVGRSVITNTGCPKLHGMLTEHGFVPMATPLCEFVKAGGSAKCLTLRLDGEDAASWRNA
jgi:N-dimethylarginine dimethylaminohydrolase